LGFFLGKWLKIDSKTSHLITCGTRLGGSAIAAITPVINQMKTDFNFFRRHFILNSIALFVFPAIGYWLHLSQEDLVCGVLLRFTTPVQLRLPIWTSGSADCDNCKVG
jgi:uncharacterized membrane protein YadS